MGDSIFKRAGQWISNTPLRSLDQAYQAALQIQSIEEKHFQGDKIHSSPDHSDNVSQYFQGQLRKQLSTIEVRLAEFRTSNALTTPPQDNHQTSNASEFHNGSRQSSQEEMILEKLQLIDDVTRRYSKSEERKEREAARQSLSSQESASALVPEQNGSDPQHPLTLPASKTNVMANPPPPSSSQKRSTSKNYKTSKTGILPRSILRTFDRLRREFSPDYEEEVITDFRTSRAKTMTSIRFLVLLAFLPLLAQIISKNFIFGPLVEHFREHDPQQVVLSQEYQEEALAEFQYFKEQLELQHLIAGDTSEERDPNQEEVLRNQALDILSKYAYRSAEGLKNVFADLLSLGVFAWLIFIGREEIDILKSFLDQIIYGLSDSAKAFIIILFTDVFVGYHSPHGWEVLLESMARHLGLPENREVIFTFIATFPVFLDTMFKYWIFRYLNRVSPSAVATYKTMND
jgi:hypothetical protein